MNGYYNGPNGYNNGYNPNMYPPSGPNGYDQNMYPPYNPNGYPPYGGNFGVNPFAASPLLLEKRQIKRLGNGIGLCVILYLVLQSVVGVILALTGLSDKFLSDDIFEYSLSIGLSVVSIGVPFAIVGHVQNDEKIDLIPLGKIKPSVFLLGVPIGLGACMLGNNASTIFNSVLANVFRVQSKSLDEATPQTAFGFFIYVVAIAVVPALIEELALRGVVMQSLRRFGDGFALVTSSVIFALMHGNLIQAPFALICGLAMGYLVLKTGSLWISITIHFCNNFLSAVLTYLEKIMSTANFQILNSVIYIVIVLLGIICFAVLAKKEPDIFSLKPAKCYSSNGQCMKAFFSSVAMVLTLIFLIGLTLSQLEFVKASL